MLILTRFFRPFGNKAFAPYELTYKGSRHSTVDVYCIAASLYYAVTGQRPTNSFNRKYEQEELIPPKQLVPNISDAVNQAILQGMALEAKDRPQTMQDWLNLLPPLQAGTGFTGNESHPTKLILASDVGVDYQNLEKLLKAGQWKAADEETTIVMLKVAKREKQGWLDYESIKNFPCTDLRTIDQLWVKYSNGHFGFSVQKSIWLECGGKVDYETDCRLGDRVGWRKHGSWLSYNGYNFSEEAPEGHLPRYHHYDLTGRFRGDRTIEAGCLLSCSDL